MMATARRLPVVVVLGATGTGKSKLAIEIGRKFNGEIISADSMQIYEGLDIITNKVTSSEQSQCRHHLISYVNPFHNTSNTVVDFRDKALPIIDRLLNEGKLPIIVGGTNYYIESLLWAFLIDKKEKKNEETTDGDASETKKLRMSDDHDKSSLKDLEAVNTAKEDVLEKKNEEISTDRRRKFNDVESRELHKRLSEVDPVSAQKIHPHNRRKVIRALEIYEEHGVPMSEIYKAQHAEVGESALSGPLRYPHTCIFWIKCDQKVLDERLDARVDGMMEQGLLQELHNFHSQYKQMTQNNQEMCDYTLGIFQSIGFKEFHNYLLLPEDERNTVQGKQLLEAGIQALKLATRQYARRQIKWIKNRLIRRPGPGVPPVYGVSSTDVSQWVEDVHKPACDTLTAILEGEMPSLAPLTPEGETTTFVRNVCEVCGDRLFTTQLEWDVHLNSRKHKKALRQQRKRLRKSTQTDTSTSVSDNISNSPCSEPS